MKYDIKKLKKNDSSLNGTSLAGIIYASYEQLEKVFGKPYGRSPDGKVKAEWCLNINGKVITIYDYKSSLPAKQNVVWHIGGNVDGLPALLTKVTGFKTSRDRS
jgi:hypothetical protein